jgi:chromosome segregation ATPase
MMQAYYPPQVILGYGGTVSASDTREFQKISYSASMQTRDVQGLTRRAETIIRGHEGRVDNVSSSKQFGSITFVVPQSSYEVFRDEIESLVDPRYLTVSIDSHNLLPQKVGIEQQQSYTQKNLDDLQAQRAKTVTAHASTVRSLQSKITANKARQAELRAEVASDVNRQNEIDATLSQLSSEQDGLLARLSSENSQYAGQIASFDQQIKWAQDSLAGIKKQDKDLLDNVATVDGTLTFKWISIREIIQSYLPGYSVTFILGILTLISYYFERRRKQR